MPLEQEPTIIIRNLLRDNWDPSNVSGITPIIHTGWFNGSWKDPQVTVTDPDEFPLRGGETGFYAIDSGGNGVKHMLGAVSVVVWSHDKDSSNINPRSLIFQMSEEVKRIVKNNIFPGFGVEWISFFGRNLVVETDVDPVMFRYDNEVRYLYQDRV